MNICQVFQAKTLELSHDYTFRVYEKANELVHTPWASICKYDPFYQIDYLKEIEDTCFPDLIPYYIIAYHNDEPLLALNFQKVIFKGEQLLSFVSEKEKKSLSDKVVSAIYSQIVKRINIPMMVLGNLLQTSHCGIIFKDENIDKKLKEILVRKGCEVAMNYAYTNTLLITNIYDNDCNCLESTKSFYNKFYSEPDLQMKIDTSWNTIEDYLALLSSKYRVRAKKVINDSKEILVRKLSMDEIVNYQSEIFALNRQVMQHSKFSLGDIHENYFTTMAQYFKDDFIINGYFYNDKLIGFSSMIKDANTLNSHFIGMEYSFIHSAKIYNKILLDNLCTAIENRATTLKYGRTATEIKSTIGAKPLDMINYLYSKNIIANFFIKQGLKYMKAPDYIVRNPFKI
jgi:hypothetical protein